ncbi:MAG: hypothetical protein HY934_00565 [Candidatus Firestonebacteria bacterium]|nr:hypothetical protein [Candidatus Firestonebacteria bacterium]
MINISISLAVGIAIFLILFFAGAPLWVSIPGGLAIIFACMFFLGKKVMEDINDIITTSTNELQSGRVENAIRILKSGYKFSKKHPFVESQLNAQIGVIYYVKKDFDKAFEYLNKSFVKHWVAQGMLAVIYMKRYDKKMMLETFEKAVRANAKEGFLWNLYAYCLSKIGQQEEAIKVLDKGSKKIPLDDKIKNNLNSLRNNEKIKMKNYGDLWYQFHLEKIPMNQRQKIAVSHGKKRLF